ncbi:hypothetical protein [Sporosarcina highlanderae]|uniref:Phospholipase D-like domain-containing protein n=1 Tax=Sporosarcina highlanderae TaxID=3035916 RepID=A0ABT8JLF0_9BACL|nr:hypothetical protein [Sporosarcina highlanderae]MDN4605895.1 hypothetical protein [Sporosarcina highlanderae]
MSIKILLRMRPEESMYRKALIDLVKNARGNYVVLSSGYFQSNVVAMVNDLSNTIDYFLSASMKNKIILVGADFISCDGKTDCNHCEFYNFVQALENKYASQVIVYDVPNMTKLKKGRANPWHAKMAFKFDGNSPTATIIGSSNVTSSAVFDWGTNGFCKHECDLYISEHDISLSSSLEDPLSCISVILDDQNPYTEKQLLETAYQEIKEVIDEIK